MKLIKIQDKFILVSDEDAKNNEFLYNIENNKICRAMGDAEVSHFKIIAGVEFLPKVDFSLLSEEDCKRIGWVDVDKNKAVCKCKRAYQNQLSQICVLCWNEIFPNEKNEVKEEDLITAQSLNDEKLIGNEQGSLDNFLLNSVLYTQEERELIMNAISNWLQQTEWDVEVEMEDVFTKNKENYVHHTGAKGNYSTHNKQPKITNNSIKILRIL